MSEEVKVNFDRYYDLQEKEKDYVWDRIIESVPDKIIVAVCYDNQHIKEKLIEALNEEIESFLFADPANEEKPKIEVRFIEFLRNKFHTGDK